MLEKFKHILSLIEQEKGPVTVFVLLKMDDFIDKWSVILCAPWATIQNRNEIFDYVKEKIVANLDAEQLAEMARLAIFIKEEHLIQELLKYKSGATLESEKVNGNTVHFAYVIKSDSNI